MKNIVVIVDKSDWSYYSHREFASIFSAAAFVEGMKAAWEISHGHSNCWAPYDLSNETDRANWEEMGSPGKGQFSLNRP